MDPFRRSKKRTRSLSMFCPIPIQPDDARQFLGNEIAGTDEQSFLSSTPPGSVSCASKSTNVPSPKAYGSGSNCQQFFHYPLTPPPSPKDERDNHAQEAAKEFLELRSRIMARAANMRQHLAKFNAQMDTASSEVRKLNETMRKRLRVHPAFPNGVHHQHVSRDGSYASDDVSCGNVGSTYTPSFSRNRFRSLVDIRDTTSTSISLDAYVMPEAPRPKRPIPLRATAHPVFTGFPGHPETSHTNPLISLVYQPYQAYSGDGQGSSSSSRWNTQDSSGSSRQTYTPASGSTGSGLSASGINGTGGTGGDGQGDDPNDHRSSDEKEPKSRSSSSNSGQSWSEKNSEALDTEPDSTQDDTTAPIPRVPIAGVPMGASNSVPRSMQSPQSRPDPPQGLGIQSAPQFPSHAASQFLHFPPNWDPNSDVPYLNIYSSDSSGGGVSLPSSSNSSGHNVPVNGAPANGIIHPQNHNNNVSSNQAQQGYPTGHLQFSVHSYGTGGFDGPAERPLIQLQGIASEPEDGRRLGARRRDDEFGQDRRIKKVKKTKSN